MRYLCIILCTSKLLFGSCSLASVLRFIVCCIHGHCFRYKHLEHTHHIFNIALKFCRSSVSVSGVNAIPHCERELELYLAFREYVECIQYVVLCCVCVCVCVYVCMCMYQPYSVHY